MELGLIRDHIQQQAIPSHRNIQAVHQDTRTGYQGSTIPRHPHQSQGNRNPSHRPHHQHHRNTRRNRPNKQEWRALPTHERQAILRQRKEKTVMAQDQTRTAASTNTTTTLARSMMPTPTLQGQPHSHNPASEGDDTNASSQMGSLGATSYSPTPKRTRFADALTTSARRIAQVCTTPTAPHMIVATPGAPPVTACFEYDSHADTCCVGKSWLVLDDTGKHCTVVLFSNELPPMENIPIMTAATVFHEAASDTTYLLVVLQALYLGSDHTVLLISPNQLCLHGIQTNKIPKQFSRGQSTFGICFNTRTTLHFDLCRVVAGLTTQLPTQSEIDSLPRLELTCIQDWDPTSQRMAKHERKYTTQYTLAVTTHLLPYPTEAELGKLHVAAAISMTNKRLSIPEAQLRKNLGNIDEATLHNTLNATTQLALRNTKKDIFS